jgi:hypothetical protein
LVDLSRPISNGWPKGGGRRQAHSRGVFARAAPELVSLCLPLVPKTQAQFGARELRSVGSDVSAWRLPHLMEREPAVLAREFKVAERTYGADHLDLVLATGYISKLLRNGRVVGYLAKH